ncbi:MAG: hypothetical protein R2827_02030 [Bdellovibrionales bacterium]
MKRLKFLAATCIWILTVGCAEEKPTFSQLAEEKSFVQTDPEGSFTKIDILWVVDNSGSMATSQANVAANFQRHRKVYRKEL